MIGRSFSLFFSIFFSRCCTRIIGHVLHGNMKVQNAFTVVVFKGFCVLFFKCIYFILLTRFVILLLVVKLFFSIVIYILLTIKCFFDIFWVAAKTLITPTQYRPLRRLPERLMKIISRPYPITWRPLRDQSKFLTENY